MASGINVGKIEADLDVNSGNMIRGLESARSALAAFMAEMKKLDSEVQRGAIDVATYNARVADLQSVVSRLTPQMQAAHAAVQANGDSLKLVNVSATQGRAAFGGLGMAMMQVGYIADDLQYGFKAIVNNLAPLGQTAAGAMGATAAQANMAGAALQIAGVAVYQLYTHWDQLSEAMGKPVLRAAAEEMEELGKKTKKTADETKRLEEYERMRASAKHRAASDEPTEKTEKEIGKVIAEHGGLAVEMGIENALTAKGSIELTEKEKEDAKKSAHSVMGPIFDATFGGEAVSIAEKKAIDKALENKRNVAKDRLLGGRDFRDREDLRKLVKEHPKMFPEGFGRKLEEAEPAEMADAKQRKIDDKLLKDQKAENKRIEAAKKSRAAEEKRKQKEEADEERESRKENVETAKKVLTGFDKRSEDSAARFVNAGQSKAEAIAHATKALMRGENGKSMNEEDAYKAAKDTVGKKFDEFTNDPDKLKAHDKAMHRDLAQRAEEAMPGLKDTALSLTASSRLQNESQKKHISRELEQSGYDPEEAVKIAKEQAGNPHDSVRNMIEAELKKAGFNPNDAAMAAEDAAKGGEHDLDKKIEHGMLHQQQKTEISTLADMRDKIQSNVSDEATKQTGLQEKMVRQLTNIATKEQKYVAIEVTS